MTVSASTALRQSTPSPLNFASTTWHTGQFFATSNTSLFLLSSNPLRIFSTSPASSAPKSATFSTSAVTFARATMSSVKCGSCNSGDEVGWRA